MIDFLFPFTFCLNLLARMKGACNMLHTRQKGWYEFGMNNEDKETRLTMTWELHARKRRNLNMYESQWIRGNNGNIIEDLKLWGPGLVQCPSACAFRRKRSSSFRSWISRQRIASAAATWPDRNTSREASERCGVGWHWARWSMGTNDKRILLAVGQGI